MAGVKSESKRCGIGDLPSLALDSGIHAGMTDSTAPGKNLCITMSAPRSVLPRDEYRKLAALQVAGGHLARRVTARGNDRKRHHLVVRA